MNNLKRILSLALASVMVMGMMVVGASATSYPDDDAIVNKDAVDTLQALNIMKGDERGFRPEDGLTRAEAAKMLATIHNKGRDVNYGVKDTPTFTDIKGHWAEGNVEYAAAFGIVTGMGNGTFDPQGSLKVVQLARMALNMMGYEEGRTGSDWEIQTTVLANDLGLFDGLDDVMPAANVTRDQAAQILVNAINADMADGESYTYTDTEETVTGLSTKWQIALSGENEVSDDVAALDGTNYDTKSAARAAIKEAVGEGTALVEGTDYELVDVLVPTTSLTEVTKTATETLAHKYLSLNYKTNGILSSVTFETTYANIYDTVVGGVTFYCTADYSEYMGQRVKVLYKSATSVYGITAIGAVVYEGTWGEYKDTYAAMAAGAAKTAIGNASIFDFNDAATTHGTIASPSTLGSEQSLKVVNNGSGYGYRAVTVPTKLETVKRVTATTITVSNNTPNLEIDEEIVGYEGIAKDDIVLVVGAANTVSGMVEVKKADIMEDVAVDAFRTVNDVNQVRVSGKWLTVLDSEDFNALKDLEANEDTTFDLTMVNGYVCGQAIAQKAAETQDLLILTALADNAVAGLDSYFEARAYFVKDGSTAIIKLASTINKEEIKKNNIYAYTVKDGITTLTTPAPRKLGYTAATSAGEGVDTNNKMDGTLIDEKAQIFVLLKDGKIEVADGKAARAWSIASDAQFGGEGSLGFTKSVNGVNYVQFAFLVETDKAALPGAGASGKDHGYIVSNPYTTSKGVNYTIWNGTEEVEVTDTAETANTLAKGDFISYATGDGVIISTKLEPTLGAVTGFNYTDKVLELIDEDDANQKLTIDDKTVYLYVDTTGVKGQATGELELAAEDEETEGLYVPNVIYVEGDEGHVDVLIIDIRNAVKDAESVGTPTSDDDDDDSGEQASTTPVANAKDNTNSVTLNSGSADLEVEVTTPADDTTCAFSWTKDSETISGATDKTYTATAAGSYVCTVTNTETGKTPATCTVTFTVAEE